MPAAARSIDGRSRPRQRGGAAVRAAAARLDRCPAARGGARAAARVSRYLHREVARRAAHARISRRIYRAQRGRARAAASLGGGVSPSRDRARPGGPGRLGLLLCSRVRRRSPPALLLRHGARLLADAVPLLHRQPAHGGLPPRPPRRFPILRRRSPPHPLRRSPLGGAGPLGHHRALSPALQRVRRRSTLRAAPVRRAQAARKGKGRARHPIHP